MYTCDKLWMLDGESAALHQWFYGFLQITFFLNFRHWIDIELKMADGGFDPCECIFNHEMAMRRLLSLLRSSQSYCTDNECLQDGLPGPGEGNSSPDNFMMMMVGWLLMAMMMYFLRPSSMRNNSTEGKPQGELKS